MFKKLNENDLLEIAINASLLAGEEIMNVYAQDFQVFQKKDESPLTMADKNANKVIEEYLRKTKIPVLSEEGNQPNYESRKNWERLWIVDPLDGTKEFVKRNGEFTVNIALVENGCPIIGVIYVPVKDILYYGSSAGAFKKENGVTNMLPFSISRDNLIVVSSRSHLTKETELYLDELKNDSNNIKIISVGSSLKLCYLAEGIADIYPRFAPTMEWDIAAGHAILKAAGKSIVDKSTGKEMVYNRKNLVNNWFIAK